MVFKILLFCLCCGFFTSAQTVRLSHELNEISGLTWYNNRLIAINDGGNDPIVFFLDENGEITHKCRIVNAVNNDWEGITCDSSGNVYIADCGNNLNNRLTIEVYKIPLDLAFSATEAIAEVCVTSIPYPSSPITKRNADFDFEAVSWEKDRLVFFSKSRAKPWHGKTFVYELNWKQGASPLIKKREVFIGSGGWMKDAITGSAELDTTTLLLTYHKVYRMKDEKVELWKRFFTWKQREGIATDFGQHVYIVSEKSIFQRYPKLEILNLK